MKNNNKQHYCGECKYYDTGEDWGLCCTNPPDVMYWGWFCFECTESCKNFEERSKKNET